MPWRDVEIWNGCSVVCTVWGLEAVAERLNKDSLILNVRTNTASRSPQQIARPPDPIPLELDGLQIDCEG